MLGLPSICGRKRLYSPHREMALICIENLVSRCKQRHFGKMRTIRRDGFGLGEIND